MRTIIAMVNMKARELQKMIVRLDIQYDFDNGEYVAHVYYTDGSEYRVDDSGRMVKCA